MEKQVFPTVITATGDEPTITITTGDADRDSDVCVPGGAQIDNYLKNPAVLFAHDYSSLPVGSTTALTTSATGIIASWRWLENDPFADRVRNAFNQGALRAASIGFRPLESESRGPGSGTLFTKWELLEWSLVPVPANASAVRTLKSLNLWRGGNDVVLRIRDEPRGKQGARHSATDMELLDGIHENVIALGSRCESVDGDDPASEGDGRASFGGNEIVLRLREDIDPLRDPTARHRRMISHGAIAEAIDSMAPQLVEAAVRSAARGLPEIVLREIRRRRGLVD